jgi:hypothetical protein
MYPGNILSIHSGRKESATYSFRLYANDDQSKKKKSRAEEGTKEANALPPGKYRLPDGRRECGQSNKEAKQKYNDLQYDHSCFISLYSPH